MSLQSTAITWSFLLAMVLYPDIFKKAQASVDRVCKGRIPDFTDKNSLPYVDALVKESLRWNPVAALSAFPLPGTADSVACLTVVILCCRSRTSVDQGRRLQGLLHP